VPPLSLAEALKRNRGAAIAIGLVVVVLFRVGFIPLFGGLGYEFALACGLLLPGVAAVWTANAVATNPREPPPIDSVLGGLARGAILALVAIAIGLLHGLRAGVCDLWGGLAGFALGPGCGALFGGTCGAIAGELARPRKRKKTIATVLALAGPIGGAAISVWRFYSSPMIFAYDPFVGYFSGTLYDTVVDAGAALLTYRVESAAFVGGALCFASVLRRTPRFLGFDVTRDRSFWARASAAALLFAAYVVMLVCGDRLGHWSTAATIARDLGGARDGVRCHVVFPSSLRDDEAALLVKDCDEELAEVEHTLDVKGPAHITAFFFKDSQDKRRLMGAADTYIAKPWREEVYLQTASYPHPVLGHEIAHVVAGTFGRGPFRVAGPLGGLFPNPGLIEGVAVATSPDEDELTDLEWAAAMKKRNALPPMSRVFSTSFLGQSASKSYTLAGAFIRWMMTVKGVAAVREWYGGKSIESIFGKSFDDVDKDFRGSLDAIQLPAAAEAYVASKFERPSVFGRRCPHEVDALKKQADGCRDSHQIDRARELYGDAIALDPNEHGAPLARAVMELRYGDAERGRSEVRAIASDEKLPLATRHKARDALADDELVSGDPEKAAEAYATLANETPDEDAARTLEVKALAARDPDARTAVTTLLVSAPGKRPPDPAFAASLLAEWYGRESKPLAAYLLGKSEISHAYFADAAKRFDVVLDSPKGELTPRIRREALRQRAVAACATSDTEAILRVRALAEDPDGVYAGSAGGRRDGVLRLLSRCNK
jgi:hypothetical protein